MNNNTEHTMSKSEAATIVYEAYPQRGVYIHEIEREEDGWSFVLECALTGDYADAFVSDTEILSVEWRA